MFFNVYKNKKGQGLVEYALIIGLIAILTIAILTVSGGNLNSLMDDSNSYTSEAQAPISTPKGK